MLSKIHPGRRTEVWQAVQGNAWGGKITAKIIATTAKSIGALPQKLPREPEPKTDSAMCVADYASKAVVAALRGIPEGVTIKDRLAAYEEAIRLLQEDLERLGQGRMLGETAASAGSVEALVEEPRDIRRPGGRTDGGVRRSRRGLRKHASCGR